MTEQPKDKPWLKVDPSSGQIIGFGTVPAEEQLDDVDHEGMLVFVIEHGTTAHDYQFDFESYTLVKRASNAIVELRKQLARERRAPTDEEREMLRSNGLAPTQAG